LVLLTVAKRSLAHSPTGSSPDWLLTWIGCLMLLMGLQLIYFRQENAERWANARLYRVLGANPRIYTAPFVALLGMLTLCGAVTVVLTAIK
jgi:hypothetical protein